MAHALLVSGSNITGPAARGAIVANMPIIQRLGDAALERLKSAPSTHTFTQGSTVMTTASAIRHTIRRETRAPGFFRRNSASSAASRIGARNRAYSTCHLAGCSTLLPRA